MIMLSGSIQREELRFRYPHVWNSKFEWKLSSDSIRLQNKVDGSMTRIVYSAEEFIFNSLVLLRSRNEQSELCLQIEEVALIISQKLFEFQGSEKWRSQQS